MTHPCPSLVHLVANYIAANVSTFTRTELARLPNDLIEVVFGLVISQGKG